MRPRFVSAAAVTVVLAIGCGGGDAPEGTSSSQAQTQQGGGAGRLAERHERLQRRRISAGEAGEYAAVHSVEKGALPNCEAGYSPCVPPYPHDVDCADVGGPITVTGSDPDRLDPDGDDVACGGALAAKP